MVEYRTFFIILSGIFAAICSLPYLIDVIRYKTKPRIATWITWSSIKAIACAAAFVDQQYITAILLLISLTGTFSIVIFGWEYGNKKFTHLDIVCLIGVAIGIVLWAMFDSPAMAVLAVILIDTIGGIPTIIHSWYNPHEETWVTFLLSLIAAILILMTVIEWKVTAYAFPLYLVFVNSLLMFVILIRRRLTEK